MESTQRTALCPGLCRPTQAGVCLSVFPQRSARCQPTFAHAAEAAQPRAFHPVLTSLPPAEWVRPHSARQQLSCLLLTLFPVGSPNLPAATWPSDTTAIALTFPFFKKAKLFPKLPIVLADAASSAPDPPARGSPWSSGLRFALEPSLGHRRASSHRHGSCAA